MTDLEKHRREIERKRLYRNRFNKNLIHTQMAKEELLKSAAMKEHLFGKHVVAIPSALQPERYSSTPRFESYATPLTSDISDTLRQSTKQSVVVGQR